MYFYGHSLSSVDSRRVVVNGKRTTLSTGKLSLGGLPRNSVLRITDWPEFTSDVYRGQKASN